MIIALDNVGKIKREFIILKRNTLTTCCTHLKVLVNLRPIKQ